MIWEKEEKELRAIVDRLTGKTTTKPVVLDQDDSEEFDRYLTGRFDETLFHLALMPESNYWMQLS